MRQFLLMLMSACLLIGCGKGTCPITVSPDGVEIMGAPVYAKINVTNTSTADVVIEGVRINGEFDCTNHALEPFKPLTIVPGEAAYAWCAGYSKQNPGKAITYVEVQTSKSSWGFDLE